MTMCVMVERGGVWSYKGMLFYSLILYFKISIMPCPARKENQPFPPDLTCLFSYLTNDTLVSRMSITSYHALLIFNFYLVLVFCFLFCGIFCRYRICGNDVIIASIILRHSRILLRGFFMFTLITLILIFMLMFMY